MTDEIRRLGEALFKKLEDSQEKFADKIALHLSHQEQKAKIALPPPRFKSEYNQRHYERASSHKLYLLDIQYYLSQGNTEDAVNTAKVFLEALDKYIEEVKLADTSPAGWELIYRSHEQPGVSVKQVEAQILEERKKRKRTQNGGQEETVDAVPQGSNKAPRQFGGPCVWCSRFGHIYKNCDVFKEDVTSGRARYDPNKRMWVKSGAPTTTPSQH